MQTLTMDQIEQVSGGDGVEAGAFVIGLGTSVGIGSALGPAGALVAAGTYSAFFFITRPD